MPKRSRTLQQHVGSKGVGQGRADHRRLFVSCRVLTLMALLVFAGEALAAGCKADPAPGVDWQDCNKSRLVIAGSALAGANLAGADFSYTDMRNSDLAGARLEKATLFRTSLDGSTADKADFARIEGYRASFVGASAQGASFASAELQRANFSRAMLTGADFQKAELGRADFSGAKLTGSNFALANLARAKLRTAEFEGFVDFASAFFFRTHIEGLDLSQAGLEQWQVDQACGDAATRLPAGLTAPATWPCDEE